VQIVASFYYVTPQAVFSSDLSVLIKTCLGNCVVTHSVETDSPDSFWISTDLVSNLEEYKIPSSDTYSILVGKPEGKRPLGGPRCRREDNIKVYLK
jgi:hypothetical protein